MITQVNVSPTPKGPKFDIIVIDTTLPYCPIVDKRECYDENEAFRIAEAFGHKILSTF